MLIVPPIPGPVTAAALALGLAAAGCAGRGKPPPPSTGPTVALLPFANESVDLRAPGLVREVVGQHLAARGYRVLPASQVDGSLRKLGVSEGGHLKGVEHARLREALPADLYGYGTVSEYGVQSAVALTRRAVSLELRLTGDDGRTAFEGKGSGQETTAGADAAGALALHLAGKMVRSIKEASPAGTAAAPVRGTAKAVDSFTDADLHAETSAAIRQALEKLPELP